MRTTLLCLLLASCATGPERYDRMPWASASLDQAKAECYMEIQRNPLLGLPTCMKAKGWQKR